jgi:DNA polymerase theta
MRYSTERAWRKWPQRSVDSQQGRNIDGPAQGGCTCSLVLFVFGVLVVQAGLTSGDALHFFHSFKSVFRGVVSFCESQIAEVGHSGYVTTLFQRKRWLFVNARDAREQASERRKVANTLCQGSAADLIKAAMHRILQAIARHTAQVKYHETARMIMQMHDELVFEVRNDRLHEMKQLIQRHMIFEDAEFQLRVPLVVRIKIGKRWGTMEPWPET